MSTESITSEALFDMGFKDTSSPDDMIFNDYTYIGDGFQINSYGDSVVDLYFDGRWMTVPNCKTIEDVKLLIKLFTP